MKYGDRTMAYGLALAFGLFVLWVWLAGCASHRNFTPENIPGLVDIRLRTLSELKAKETYVVPGDSHKWALNNLIKWSAKHNLTINFTDLSAEGLFGRTGCSAQCVVEIDPGYSANSQLDTLLHELSHMLIRPADHNSGEIIAEAVAMLTAQQIGLDTSSASLAYIGRFSPMTIQGTLFINAPQINYAVKVLSEAAHGR